MSMLSWLSSCLDKKNIDVVVVFDGNGDSLPCDCKNYKNVKTLYTIDKESADDLILNVTESTVEKICIISSDNELCRKCKIRGANVKSVKEFFFTISKSKCAKNDINKKKVDPSILSEASIKKFVKIFENELEQSHES